MTPLHLSEFELQQAAEAAAPLAAPHRQHLRSCPLCQARAAAYRQLFAAAASLPAPAFNFDVAAVVLARLPRPRPAFSWVIGLVGALVLSVVIAALALLGPDLLPAFQGLPTVLGGATLAVAGCVVAGHCWELLARHRRQLNRLALA